MPEQPQQPQQQPIPQTVIFQNTNQQNNDGCGTNGCGMGCLLLIVACVLLFPIGMMGSALEGEAPGYWIPLGIFLTLVEIVIIGAIAFVWLDKKFGWGYTDQANPNESTIRPEDLAGDVSNYGVSTPGSPVTGETRAGRTEQTESKEAFQERMDRIRREQSSGTARKPKVSQSVNLPRAESVKLDVYERLRRLKELRDEGHITSEEYEAKKAELVKLL